MRSSSVLVWLLSTAVACAGPRGDSTGKPPAPAPTDTAGQPDREEPGPSAIRTKLEANPEDGGILYVLARSAASRGAKDEALEYLRRLAALDAWDYPLQPADFGPLTEVPEYGRIAAQLRARAPQLKHGPVALELDRVDLLPEGVSWDPKRKELLVGSMYERAVLAADARGQTRTVVAPKEAGLLGVLGMDVDEQRDELWVVAVGAPFVPGLNDDERGRGGVWGFSLEDRSPEARTRIAQTRGDKAAGRGLSR